MTARNTQRHLRPAEITTIARLVSEFDVGRRPTWDSVAGAAFATTKRVFSRQSLSDHPAIKNAYEAKVDEYRVFSRTGKKPNRITAPTHDERLQAALTRIEEQDVRIAEQDRIILLHVQNAIRCGITQRRLEEPTAKYEKGRTDGDGKTSPHNGGPIIVDRTP